MKCLVAICNTPFSYYLMDKKVEFIHKAGIPFLRWLYCLGGGKGGRGGGGEAIVSKHGVLS